MLEDELKIYSLITKKHIGNLEIEDEKLLGLKYINKCLYICSIEGVKYLKLEEEEKIAWREYLD